MRIRQPARSRPAEEEEAPEAPEAPEAAESEAMEGPGPVEFRV